MPPKPVITPKQITAEHLPTRSPETNLGKLLRDFIETRTPDVDRPDLIPDLVSGELRLEDQRLRRSIVAKLFGLAYVTLALGASDMILRASVVGYSSPNWLPWLIGSGLMGAIVGFFTSTRFADWLFRSPGSHS